MSFVAGSKLKGAIKKKARVAEKARKWLGRVKRQLTVATPFTARISNC